MAIQTLSTNLKTFYLRRAGCISLILAFALTISACATLVGEPVRIGETESELMRKMGSPTRVHQGRDGRILEYRRGPWGQSTYMARLGQDNRLISFEQVLTVENFATIPIGKANKNDILHRFGSPTETSFLSLSQLEVWSYPYKESDTWNSVMHIHFDRNGIVHSTQSGPDLRFDRDSFFPFGMMGM